MAQCLLVSVSSLVLSSSLVAAQSFEFLMADRYIEGTSSCTDCDPPDFDEQRIDAIGFQVFDESLVVQTSDDFGSGARASVSQYSRFANWGFVCSGRATGNEGAPAGSSSADTHAFFSTSFQFNRDIEVPFHLFAIDDYSLDSELAGSFHFTGPGVDIHFENGSGLDRFVYDDFVSLQAFGEYTLTLDLHASAPGSFVTYDTHLMIPAPATVGMLLLAPLAVQRRR